MSEVQYVLPIWSQFYNINDDCLLIAPLSKAEIQSVLVRHSYIHTYKNLTTCEQDVFACNRLLASLSTNCNNAVIYQVATRLSLTTC